jgi:hypothetical protein
MTSSTWYFSRNPKFTDAFERDLANNDAQHIGRDEPSVSLTLLIVDAFRALARAVRFLRASAQQPATGIRAS